MFNVYTVYVLNIAVVHNTCTHLEGLLRVGLLTCEPVVKSKRSTLHVGGRVVYVNEVVTLVQSIRLNIVVLGGYLLCSLGCTASVPLSHRGIVLI